VPVFTDLPAAQLTLLGDQLASGFAAGHADMKFEPGSDVAVFGCGPVGLGAIQAGRVFGAGQVIAIDPIRYRREFALKMGATLALLGRTIHPGQQGGLHILRDIPRYVKLIEKGKIDAKSVITKTYTLDQSVQAIQDTADRTIITGVIEFT